MSSPSPSRRARSPNVLNFTSPSNSPGRPQRLIQEGLLKAEDPAYKSAMEKIYEASWKFDRAKNEDLMKTLDNRELLPEQFRQMLKAGMNCRFTNEEFEAIFPIFDNHGFVDGTEFIMLFYRYRYEHREQLLKARAEINRRRHELEKAIKEKQAEDLENKRILELVNDFTPADEKSALDKLINAAVKYDRLMPGAVPLDAFDVEKMNPGEFREQMKSVFKVNFTLRELSAFIAYFNRDKNPSDKTVNCAAFLVTFFRMGFRERSNRLHEIWAEKKRVAEEKAKKIKEEEEELAQKNALKVNFVFTPEDRERAIVKLRTAAKLYDKTTPGAMSMKAFEVKEMAPHIFKEQLRRIFNLQVTPAEMGALMTVFDVNGDGVITCEEFTKVFINMGFEEREKELKEAREKQKQYEEYKKLQEMKKKQEMESKNALKVSYQFTSEEFNTAMQKLIEAAWRYDKTMPGAASLEAFEAQYMEAHILKDQLKKAFHIKLSPQELGAIMNYFDTENTGKIHCSSFLKKFFRVGYEERQRKKELWRIHQKNLIEKRLEEEKQKLENLSMKNSVVLSSAAASIAKANASINGGGGGDNNTNNDPNLSSSLSAITPSVPGQDFTEKDFQNAFFKLTLGAIKYDRSLPNAMNLTAFECISMPPHIFREQLKLTFNVKVTVPELWALVSYFDKDHSGEINCKTFINQFLRTGYEERNRIKEQWRIMKLMKEEEMKQKEINDIKYKEEMAYKECDFDFNESEFNSILFRFVIMCHTIDKRTIGPAGLTAFESESLNPSEFREMLKRTFNFKVNNKELGALVNYFDVLGKKVVHCPTFINSFTQIRGHCDDFKGKPDEQQKLLQYVLGLKESYRHRVAKNPSVEARPWRQQNAISSFHGNKKIFKKKDPKPLHDPLEKYRLRVLIGRKTGRMDLTTKAFWPPKPSEDELAQGNSRSPSPAGSRQSKSRKSRHSVRRSRSPSPSASIRSLNSEQLIEDDEREKEEGEEDKENQEDDEGENEKVAGSVKQPSVTIKLDDISPRSGLFADIAMTSRTRGISQRSLSVDEEKSMADDKSVHSMHSMLSMNSGIKDDPIVVPTSLPVEEELEFRLNVIPPEIFRITDLRELWLDNHCINIIPSEINQLKNLQLLSIKNNQLEILPTQICDLMHLNKCYFNNNLLTVLPNLFWKCSSLQEINLSNNQFQEFPEVITAITSLRVVELSNNYIKDLPKSLYHMKSLQFLFLEKNEFISPPLILSRLPWVNVSGCPIPVDSKSASSLTITPSEEYELLGMLKGRAAVKITSKLRRRKKKTNYLS